MRAGGCCLYNVTDEHWVFEHGRLSKPEGFGEGLEKVPGAGGESDGEVEERYEFLMS